MERAGTESVVVGLGGAGCQIVGRLAGRADATPATVVVDSDACALAGSAAASRIQVGEELLDGFGSGGDADKGRDAMEADVGRVTDAFEGARLAVVVFGAGGGVGGGGAPILVHALRQAGCVVITIAVTPFAFEGRQRATAAQRTMDALEETGCLTLTVPADALIGTPSEPLPEVFEQAADVLTGAVLALHHMVTEPGYVAMGVTNIRQLADDTRGPCRFAFCDAAGDGRAARVVEQLTSSPMCDNGAVLGECRLLLVCLVGGEDLTLREVGDVMSAVHAMVRAECRIAVGTSIACGWQGRMSALVIAGEKRKVRPTVEVPPPEEESTRPTAAPAEAPPQPEPPVRSRRRRSRQARLPLEAAGRGRFKDVEPTIVNGEDFDVPTFVRRGIKIDR